MDATCLLPPPPPRRSSGGPAGGAVAAAALEAGKGWQSAVLGPSLQCFEAASLGMPLEVWKTYLGRNRGVGTLEAVAAIYRDGGLGAFWAGTTAKLAESASKGLILVVAKEGLLNAFSSTSMSPGLAGALAGAGGGAAQTVVIAPLTYIVTAAVTGAKRADGTKELLGAMMRRTYASSGVKGFYPGGNAIALRQMSNWASRQGFTEWARGVVKGVAHGADAPADTRLTPGQEVAAGVIGGTLACWNHPIEVARIEAQARANAGEPPLSIGGIWSSIVKERGPAGLFKGIVPRAFLGVWQTLCMVTGVKMVQSYLKE